ncbi:capsular biosynthesis protein [Virgibacillus sp. MSP4-1]|uniref:YveK family protein n=1 Tax=Virgibacillus sp. MSP4-1 TaxID=2700081 RepID=UPI00039E88DC|nr:Wzz/FepE/Etk N-terminal domain-containing protein [Virgibacillus sp. MSP4-1]QHS23487.1 capsular biosynthesis protein [Virgibacillus sp. MSP4-1]
MEETISLKEIYQTLKKHMLLILSITFFAAFIAAIISYFVLTPVYQSSSQFIVNQQSSQNSESEYNVNDIRTNVELINTYNVIIKSPAILDNVVEELNLDITAGALEKKIQVNSAENSQVVNIVVQDPDPELATQLANTIVSVFQDQVPVLLNVDNVQILSEAQMPADPQPVKPNPVLNIAIALVLGAMIGVGLAFLLEYLDNTIKTEEDVENHLGLPVLGVVAQIKDEDIRPAGARKPSLRMDRKRGGTFGA